MILSRLVPRSLAGRFILLLATALVFANVVALVLLDTERARFAREARRGAQVERIATLVPVLISIPPRLRNDVARAASSPGSILSVDAEPLVREGERGWLTERLIASFDDLGVDLDDARINITAIGPRPPRPVRDRDRRGPRNREDRQHRGHHPDPGGRAEADRAVSPQPDLDDNDDIEEVAEVDDRGERAEPGGDDSFWQHWRRWRHVRVEASIPLGDGSWLNLRQRRPEPPPPVIGGAILFALFLSLAAVLAVGVVFIRRITRPLSALAAAAAQAGAGDRTATVPESGARELREAAAAFNAMQRRIALFDAERARTIAAVGHDLRTPITSLRIRAEMLDDDTRDAMVKTLEEMRVMADGLLAYGRSEADAEPAATLDLAALLRELCDPPGGAVAYRGPAAFPFEGRPVALSRAFANIVGNARRYAGSATVTLASDREGVTVTIADDGPGIPEDKLDAVFEPFMRLDPSRSSETGGEGLGLAIARSLIRAHGGTIVLANRDDAPGLIATVRLPASRVSPPPPRR